VCNLGTQQVALKKSCSSFAKTHIFRREGFHSGLV